MFYALSTDIPLLMKSFLLALAICILDRIVLRESLNNTKPLCLASDSYPWIYFKERFLILQKILYHCIMPKIYPNDKYILDTNSIRVYQNEPLSSLLRNISQYTDYIPTISESVPNIPNVYNVCIGLSIESCSVVFSPLLQTKLISSNIRLMCWVIISKAYQIMQSYIYD